MSASCRYEIIGIARFAMFFQFGRELKCIGSMIRVLRRKGINALVSIYLILQEGSGNEHESYGGKGYVQKRKYYLHRNCRGRIVRI